jgi:curli production assembly/transport component CsgF
MNKYQSTAVLILGIWFYALPAFSGELTYQPVNPNFGGNPFNAAPLLASAQAQNNHKDPDAVRRGATGQSFEERIDRLVLSALARSILGNISDPATGELIPGVIDTGLSTIEVTDDGITLTITVTDNVTGEFTIFTAPSIP